ncbi:hypothetical protein Q4E93_01250 [Flavitalea sp. BT771]|uniref:hypothetical protein n=1 Tax=Flavitalea sp. BT771 TaxID=3063329 RepID=UPI0026E31D5E|nr:hypothetical protein [Flavitalea sp. BT771]MDO6429193.1 hypothetical protein [Flavitalea sp. BT771]MDV6218679.1 hypothetical protein [Flavitalea sp. BT771]
MRIIIICLFLFVAMAHRAGAQPQPSPEDFVNQVFHMIVDSSFSKYYLVERADSCRFEKYDYDEWTKYYLKEPVSLAVMNELAQKVYLSHIKYDWRQDQLKKAVCITARKGDSLFTISNPALTARSTGKRKILRQWQELPAEERTLFSFSLPHFTDDGQYAVIDLNFICGIACGTGFTFLFRHASGGWKLIGKYANWSA